MVPPKGMQQPLWPNNNCNCYCNSFFPFSYSPLSCVWVLLCSCANFYGQEEQPPSGKWHACVCVCECVCVLWQCQLGRLLAAKCTCPAFLYLSLLFLLPFSLLSVCSHVSGVCVGCVWGVRMYPPLLALRLPSHVPAFIMFRFLFFLAAFAMNT